MGTRNRENKRGEKAELSGKKEGWHFAPQHKTGGMCTAHSACFFLPQKNRRVAPVNSIILSFPEGDTPANYPPRFSSEAVCISGTTLLLCCGYYRNGTPICFGCDTSGRIPKCTSMLFQTSHTWTSSPPQSFLQSEKKNSGGQLECLQQRSWGYIFFYF